MKKVELIWHQYPKEKPKEEGEYLVTADVLFGYAKEVLMLNYLKYNKFGLNDDRVAAWAKLPEPYKGE